MKKLLKLLALSFILFISFFNFNIHNVQDDNVQYVPKIKRTILPTNSILSLESVTVAEVSTVYYNYNNQFKQFISCNTYVDIYYDDETNLIKAFNINLNWYLSDLSTGNNNINLKSALLNSGTYYRNVAQTIKLNELTGARIYLAVDSAMADNATNDTLDTILRFTLQYNATTINWTDIDINTSININNYIDVEYYDAQGRIPFVRAVDPGLVVSSYSFTSLYDVGYNSGYEEGRIKGRQEGYEVGKDQNIYTWIEVLERIFVAISKPLMVEVFPNITLLSIILAPVILGVVFWLIQRFR